MNPYWSVNASLEIVEGPVVGRVVGTGKARYSTLTLVATEDDRLVGVFSSRTDGAAVSRGRGTVEESREDFAARMAAEDAVRREAEQEQGVP
jgi:hypothetical protein